MTEELRGAGVPELNGLSEGTQEGRRQEWGPEV